MFIVIFHSIMLTDLVVLPSDQLLVSGDSVNALSLSEYLLAQNSGWVNLVTKCWQGKFW